jgi:MFS transporter, DHA2 family, multidrug resistance protein
MLACCQPRGNASASRAGDAAFQKRQTDGRASIAELLGDHPGRIHPPLLRLTAGAMAVSIHSQEAVTGVPTAPPKSLGNLNWLLLGLGLATGMEFYTADSINLVLTDLAGSFGVSGDEASWSLTTYSSAVFIGTPICVWLASHVGHKTYLICSVILFVAASVTSATSYNFQTMLVARAFQGLAGAGLVVWWRGTVYLLLPKAQRSASLMRVSTMLYLSSALGMLFSGYITDTITWRLICIPNIAYAIGALWLLVRYFPNVPARPSSRPTDWPGIILVSVALISLQIILSRGQIDDWLGSPRIRILVWLATLALLFFGFWQTSARNPAPLLQVKLLRDRYVLSSALIGILTGVIMSGSLYLLPEFMRNVAPQPLSATQAGQVMAVYALTAAALRPLVAAIIPRVGQRKTICGAILCLIASMGLLSQVLTTDTPVPYFYLPLVLYACCISALLPAIGGGTVAQLAQEKLLDGVALYMTFRQFGAALGVALVTMLVEWRETLHSSRLFDHLRSSDVLLQDYMARTTSVVATHGGHDPLKNYQVALKLLAEAGGREAATLAYADGFLFMAVVGVLTLCVVPLIPPTPVPGKR